jgi:predicted RNase H-like nuclease (RuvC/YqgF family)
MAEQSPETIVSLIVSILAAVAAVVVAWRQWSDSRAMRALQSQDTKTKEWAALLEAQNAHQERLEEQLSAYDAEIKALQARMAEMEDRHDRERKAWMKERRELEQRIALLEKERADLREELDALKAEAGIR